MYLGAQKDLSEQQNIGINLNLSFSMMRNSLASIEQSLMPILEDFFFGTKKKVIARQGYTNLRTFKAEPAPPLGRQVQERLKIVRGWARGAGGQQEFAVGIGPPGISEGHQPSSVSARAASKNWVVFRNPAPRRSTRGWRSAPAAEPYGSSRRRENLAVGSSA